jgi:hypothetical protein
MDSLDGSTFRILKRLAANNEDSTIQVCPSSLAMRAILTALLAIQRKQQAAPCLLRSTEELR